MEDFIYILIGIAWIGFSIYSQQKKLKKKQEEAAARKSGSVSRDETAEQKTTEKSLFDKLFEEDQQQEESVEQAWRNQPARETATVAGRLDSVEQVHSRQEITESNSRLSSEYYKSIKEKETQKEKEEAQEAEGRFREENQRDFDLRKAVIYSVILERPYD